MTAGTGHCRVWIGGLALAISVSIFGSVPGQAATPDDPEVQKLLNAGVNFLATGPKDKYATEFGGKCLLALAVWKHTRDPNHPLVKAGLEAALKECAAGEKVGSGDPKRMYSISVAGMLLCELDSSKYAKQIQAIIDALVKSQQGHGGFGYAGQEDGDTSQVQYVMLAYWTASHHGFNVPDATVEKACNWLLRTQDINGAFAYMPKDPGSFTRMQQRPASLSCAAAGLGSVLIAADMLGLEHPNAARNREGTDRSGSVRAVQEPKTEERRQATKNVNLQLVLKSIEDGVQYLKVNGSDPGNDTHRAFYYMYGFERYQSFWEKFNGLDIAEPAWYDAGVQFLKRKQHQNGSWYESGGYHGAACDTALAMMFLMRSTKQMIKQTVDGVLLGGMGLPSDVSNVMTTGDGRIAKPELFKSMDGLLALLDKDDPAMSSVGAMPDTITLSEDPKERASQLARLRRMAESGSWQARKVALQVLGKTRDFDNIPWLIYGLSDPEEMCRQEANTGLRFMTRKFHGFGLSDSPTPDEVRHVQEQWKAWYQTLRPEVQFLEE